MEEPNVEGLITACGGQKTKTGKDQFWFNIEGKNYEDGYSIRYSGWGKIEPDLSKIIKKGNIIKFREIIKSNPMNSGRPFHNIDQAVVIEVVKEGVEPAEEPPKQPEQQKLEQKPDSAFNEEQSKETTTGEKKETKPPDKERSESKEVVKDAQQIVIENLRSEVEQMKKRKDEDREYWNDVKNKDMRMSVLKALSIIYEGDLTKSFAEKLKEIEGVRDKWFEWIKTGKKE